MTVKALYWTTNGTDIWRVTERVVFEFKNLDTGEVVRCETATEVIDAKLVPVMMPKVGDGRIRQEDKVHKQEQLLSTKPSIKPSTKPSIKPSTKPSIKPSTKPSSMSSRKKSNYKGVIASHTAGKFRVQFWDREKKELIHLGTFKSELLAAAAYQDHIGNTKEAVRLREEYAEGDRMPEGPDSAPEPQGKYKGVYPVKTAKGKIRYHAQITHKSKKKYLGIHDTIKQAAAAIEEFRKKAAEQERQPGQFPSED